MAQSFSAPGRPRWPSLLGVGLLHALLGYVLLTGLALDLPKRLNDTLTVINLRPPPPPPPEPKAAEPEGASAPAQREARPVPREAPPPVVRVEPPVVVAAPVAADGPEAVSGAAPLPGPGTGGGGEGYGTGSGGDGFGAGSGGTPARWLSGRIRPSDYPDDALDDGVEGITGVRLTIGINGRVVACAVTRSSGSRDLDDATCPLIRKRFRYEPALDASGRPVVGTEDGAQEWTIERRERDDR